MMGPERVVLLATLILITLAIISGIMHEKQEREHPCLEYGPEQVAYYMNAGGGIMVPVYQRPCLKRQ
jgi:uncharacterized SAM-binding protein YcdF (DUF218 family)